MAKKLQRQIDNSFKAVAVMLPSPILNLGMVSSFKIKISSKNLCNLVYIYISGGQNW